MMLGHSSTTAGASDQQVAVGDVIAGYRVERILSQRTGRYTVVEAVSPKSKRVALRIFTGAASKDEELRRRVSRLASLGDSIEHPLLPVLGTPEIGGGRLCLAYALPRGDTLAGLLRAGPLERDEAISILSQVAGALDTARALGVPVGDLRPEDIVVASARPRQALLINFGISDSADRGCESPSAIEGAHYRSPEQVRGEPADAASSVYALACILVECLTGAPPYPYERPLLTLHAHLVEAPPRVSERIETLPTALDEVVATGLSKHPQQRPASAAALMRAAQRALGVKAPIPVGAVAAAKTPKRTRAPAPEQPRKRPPERIRVHPPRPARRRRSSFRGPVAVGLGLALLASTAGFAAGSNLGGTTKPTVSRAVATDRAAYLRAVEDAIERLGAQRIAARRELRGARRASAQAAAATKLAGAYREAADALAATRAPTSTDAQLVARLRGAQGAYRRLAAAATRHHARAFRAARRAVVDQERELSRTLTRL